MAGGLGTDSFILPDTQRIAAGDNQETADAVDWILQQMEEEKKARQRQQGATALGVRQDRMILMGAYGI